LTDFVAYYERRAGEYDEWYEGKGRFATRERPGWDAELDEVVSLLAALPPARTLDIACGTGFMTRHLRGEVVGLDQSASMLEVAAEQAPDARFVQGDALSLPFDDGDFDRVFTSYFYCHLEDKDRMRFLEEARRVAPELVVVATVWREGEERERWEERQLKDGSRWHVYKRVFTADQLSAELGSGDVLHEGHWFLVVKAPL
jgi:SAM-dependent methyltransferase